MRWPAGARVTLFQQFGFGHDRGSSHGVTRLFRSAYKEFDFLKHARFSGNQADA